MKFVVLKRGKEAIFAQKHHWIFSGAIESYSDNYIEGELAQIRSHRGEILGYGFFNRKVSLAGRIVSFGQNDPYLALKEQLIQALEMRKPLFHSSDTTAFRLINGEGDGFPGLVIDKYNRYLVLQTGALGMRKLLPFLIEQLKTAFSIDGIYDKSKGSSLKEEGIEPQEATLFGTVPDEIEIRENGIHYRVALKSGQKTGFFLDQREMRSWVTQLSQKRKVLNGFCYTGGFTLAALKGGALCVDSVDISSTAIEGCRTNIALNGFSEKQGALYQQDVFQFLNEHSCDYDFIVLDPPAFAKKKKDIPAATKGYKQIFRLALQKILPASYLLVSSCSHYITETIFENSVRIAALEAGRTVRIIGHHRLAIDHPINLFHPESRYLKSLLLFVI